jgi:AhpC/TSA family
MVPHERSLVEQMQGRPFALLGINCDDDKEVVQQVSLRNHLPWRNWWDGDGSVPVSARYGVRSFPATYVLDANGVVRYRNLRSPELEQAAEKLVRELEQQNSLR